MYYFESKIRLALSIFLLTSITGYTQVSFQFDHSILVYKDQNELLNPWAGGLNSGQYSRIEINGDSEEDLIIYDRTTNLLNVFIASKGKYVFSPEYRVFFPEDIIGWILIKDFDCDGRKDIFTHSSQGIRVFRNITTVGSTPEWDLVADPVLTESTSGIINLQVNITDIPSIEDIDGDGDLDILVYNFAIGGYIRQHNNRSVERTGACQDLDFELVSRDWGGFEECDCFLYAFETNNETCENINPSGRVMHPGGKSLLLIDMDNDGDKDFLGGHEQCNELYYLENKGDSAFARMETFSASFPDSLHPANFPIFPAGYYDDFDNDGIKDLIVAPNDEYNLQNNIDQSHTSWLYKNTGTNQLPRLIFQNADFIQSDMIDVGGNAVPLLVDVEGDGDLDLLIGGNGKNEEGFFYGQMIFYENTGNTTEPKFTLKETDYLGISQWHRLDVLPVNADLNHDGAEDLVIVSTNPQTGSVEARLMINQAKPGFGLKVDPGTYSILSMNIKQKDAPEFTDVDNDGLIDLLLGKSTGRLEYYRNVGNDENPVFDLIDPAFLGIDDSYIEFKRNLVPFVFDFDLNGKDDLLTTDYTGVMTIYIDYKGSANKSTSLIYNSLLEEITLSQFGYQTWMSAGLLNGNTQITLFLGTKAGGVSTLINHFDPQYPENNTFNVTIFPNPLQDDNILSCTTNQDCELYFFNSVGQQLENIISLKSYQVKRLEIGYLPQGTYILKFVDSLGHEKTHKLIRY